MATSAQQWKKNRAQGLKELPLPSGNTCLVRAPGIQAFLTQGFIPNSLLDIVMKSLNTNAGKPQKTKKQEEEEAVAFMREIQQDPEKLADLLTAVDKVTVECVVEPLVHPIPDVGDPRDEELLYVDEVEFDDKMFIFQFVVGGTRDVEKFRKGVASNVDAVQDRPRTPRPTKRTTQRKR